MLMLTALQIVSSFLLLNRCAEFGDFETKGEEGEGAGATD